MVREPGRPLASVERLEWESRFGASLGGVRIHDGAAAAQSARDVDAAAYSVGRHVVLGGSRPATPYRRHLLAHELAHVVAGSGAGASSLVQRYRPRGSFAYGERDTKALVERPFDPKADRETKPWIQLVEVEFTGSQTDVDGAVFSTGTATVSYYANAVKLPGFVLSISGGSAGMKSDPGSFTVHRIEGFGYNSGSASGTPGVDFKWSDREGPNSRYTKKDSSGFRAANMSFAVFYNKGEALHAGPLDVTSHGCVHVDWNNEDAIKQLNYHSVIGLTKVKVSYKGP
ncbi:eCIS core domain-containing protein [Agrococcus sp. DT81.2]|uniref:eCIS core domain-containing protein n=1 Tax=Agrococcus sp. DT81.2 TaxID=3393414 RepID=UPI003CE5909C